MCWCPQGTFFYSICGCQVTPTSSDSSDDQLHTNTNANNIIYSSPYCPYIPLPLALFSCCVQTEDTDTGTSVAGFRGPITSKASRGRSRSSSVMLRSASSLLILY